MDSLKFSRRNFIKNGLMAAAGIVGTDAVLGTDCPGDPLEAPGPIPLNNILVDYRQINQKFGFGLSKTAICDEDSWESKKENIRKCSRLILGKAPNVGKITVEPDVFSEIQRDGYRKLKIEFPSGTGDTIKGYQLLRRAQVSWRYILHGRIGTFRGRRSGKHHYGGTALVTEGETPSFKTQPILRVYIPQDCR